MWAREIQIHELFKWTLFSKNKQIPDFLRAEFSSAFLITGAQLEGSLKNFLGMWLLVKLRAREGLESSVCKGGGWCMATRDFFQNGRGNPSQIHRVRLSWTFQICRVYACLFYLFQLIKFHTPVSMKLFSYEGSLQPGIIRYLLNASHWHIFKSRKTLFESPNKCFLSSENTWPPSGPVFCLVQETQPHFPYFNTKCSYKLMLPLAEESKIIVPQPDSNLAFTEVGPGSASTRLPHTCSLGPCSSLSSQASSLGWRHWEQTHISRPASPSPAPKRGLPLLLLCHPVGSFWRTAHVPSIGRHGLGPRGRGSWFQSVSQSRIYRARFGDDLEPVISEVSLG